MSCGVCVRCEADLARTRFNILELQLAMMPDHWYLDPEEHMPQPASLSQFVSWGHDIQSPLTLHLVPDISDAQT